MKQEIRKIGEGLIQKEKKMRIMKMQNILKKNKIMMKTMMKLV
jgi:hypothetical protein